MNSNYETLLNICSQRRSTRSFSARGISSANLDKILKIAHTAPYASGSKKWELMVINDTKIIQKIAEAVREKSDEIQGNILDDYQTDYLQYSENFCFFKFAPVLIIPDFQNFTGFNGNVEQKLRSTPAMGKG